MKRTVKITVLIVMAFVMALSIGFTVVTPKTETAFAAVYQQGSNGSTVKTIQRKLKNWGYYKGSVDGIFGSQTKEAVKYFQRKNGDFLHLK